MNCDGRSVGHDSKVISCSVCIPTVKLLTESEISLHSFFYQACKVHDMTVFGHKSVSAELCLKQVPFLHIIV